ncbi:unnamed protein product [Rotaria sordida]|uniref:OTU domain-containing protein n=2 Tax=Rotaria sordida TaxID=392033 RepID=A0A815A241_9BILA|nr:unnamed protein product [Rotaria sordida]
MVTYSIKDLMSLCSDYALDAQIQKILFSLDLWVPKAAREVHIDNVAQQRYAATTFTGFNRARSPTRNDSISNNNINNRLRRTLALRSMSAEVFRSSIDTGNSGSYSRIINTNDSRDLNKINTTSTNISLMKKSSNGQNLDDISSTGQSQIKLMPILEGGENEDKLIEQSTTRINTNISTMINTTTIDWTPAENEPSTSTTGRTSIDALFELSVRADSALKTALCENNAMATINVSKTNNNNDRITLLQKFDQSIHKRDSAAEYYLQNHCDKQFRDTMPMAIVGDGNCFYNTFLKLSGAGTTTEASSVTPVELRARNVVELVLRTNEYKIKYKSLEVLLDNFEQYVLKEMVHDTHFATIWDLLSIPTVLNIDVISIYPKVNGDDDMNYKLLNSIRFKPLISQETTNNKQLKLETIAVRDVKLLFSNCNKLTKFAPKKQDWMPNHFVPLLNLR